MMSLKLLSLQLLKPSRKQIAVAFISLSFVGFADAAYLTILHYLAVLPPCSVVSGCEKVLTSQYSEVVGIPLALFGAVYYLFIFFLSITALSFERWFQLYWAAFLTIGGLAVSLSLVYLQVFVINSLCFYCLISAGINILLFAVGIVYIFKVKASKIYI